MMIVVNDYDCDRQGCENEPTKVCEHKGNVRLVCTWHGWQFSHESELPGAYPSFVCRNLDEANEALRENRDESHVHDVYA